MAQVPLTCVVRLGIHAPVTELYSQLFTGLPGPAVDNAAARQQLKGETWEENKHWEEQNNPSHCSLLFLFIYWPHHAACTTLVL